MLYSTIIALATLASSVLAAPSAPVEKRQSTSANNLNLIQQLELAATAVDRANLLTPADMVFDFNQAANPPSSSIVQGAGGSTVRADRKTFPALIGSGGSMTLGFLGPCGFNTPHVHNRGTELNIVVQGRLLAAFTQENGVPNIMHNISQYQLTVFPQGAMHTEMNPDCTPAVFVAAFPSEDPGVQQSAQTFFGFEDDFVTAVLGGDISVDGKDLDTFRPLIPANVANGVESCLQKCGIQKREARPLRVKR